MDNGTIFEHGDLVTRKYFCLGCQEQERDDARNHNYLGHDHNFKYCFYDLLEAI
jgi:hypothetical protein